MGGGAGALPAETCSTRSETASCSCASTLLPRLTLSTLCHTHFAMDFQSMLSQASMGGAGPGAGAGGDQPQHDNAEMIYISSLALLKVRLGCQR